MGNKQIKSNNNKNQSIGSCSSIFGTYSNSQQSVCSVSRPWSRISRRRWKESTLTLPYESSKTIWPVTQIESNFLPEFPLTASINNRNIDILEEINKGSFSKVYKVLNKEKGEIFALKVLSKSKIIRENCVRQVKEEVQIQKVCGHFPFIVEVFQHWQNRRNLFIVSQYVAGGELYDLLKKYLILPIELVQLYVGQIALALDFLHNAGIIYRDLKPENLLLDKEGNLQLIDFGLSKWLPYNHTTNTICGTLHFMAPEILAFQPYGHSVDWWSLGVIACLMLTNHFPTTVGFHSENTKIMKKTVVLPKNVDLNNSCQDLLFRLLEIEPVKRIKSVRTLQTIAFYKGYDFLQITEKKIKPNDLIKKHFTETEMCHFQDFDENF